MRRLLVGFGLIVLAGCGESEPSFTVAVPHGTATAAPTFTATPQPTATTVPTPASAGPEIVFFGVLRADNVLVQPSGMDDAGRPIYERSFGSGFVLVVEGRPGTDHAAVGHSAFNFNADDPTVLPDLQMLTSRDLGNGSTAVCDNTAPNFGGVPGIDPPVFDNTQRVADAINDLGCRVNDGTGAAMGRQSSQDACAVGSDGEFRFVNPTASIEFCMAVDRAIAFPSGDTIVTARLRDASGTLGPSEQIVIRNTQTSS